jgi:methionyl-tRNA formyltransferase
MLQLIREEGPTAMLRTIWLFISRRARGCSPTTTVEDLPAYCSVRGIELIVTERLDTPEALDELCRLAPDLALHAGAGILRRRILAIPRHGTLNAHMGLLRMVRGTNAAEWSVLRSARGMHRAYHR